MAKRKSKVDPDKKKRSRKKPEDSMPDELQEEFFNREIEWLEFNNRVLHEALDARTPLLERVRFLGICTSNLDEFFMKRVGGLKGQVEAGVQRKAGGLTALQALVAIRAKVKPMFEAQADCYKKQLLPALVEKGIYLLKWKELSAKEQTFAAQYFKANVFPVLTPLAVDPGLPFPFLSNLSTSLGITLKHPEREEKLFARIKVPKIFPQWIQVYSGDEASAGSGTVSGVNSSFSSVFRFVSLVEVIQNNLKGLFPDMEVIDVMPFRITRNADVERLEEDADDLLEMVAEELKQRRFAEVVRLEHGPKVDSWMLNFLMEELELTENQVYEHQGFLDFTDLKPIADLNIAGLRYDTWTPVVPTQLQEEGMNLFHLVKNNDFLVHHPYESFSVTVERFIQSAAEDPKVLAIKMTLYRTGDDSPFIPSLIRAAEAGKQVACLIELKARFDEERNIHWAQALEDAGVHVVYGVVGLKTHAKTALVVRQENDGLQCYAHIGTGNYHKDTAKLYTDVGLFTSKPAFTEDVVELFHFLTGRSLKRNYQKLLVAPIAMKDRFLEMIRNETEHAKAGRPARIIAKCNSLEDVAISRALYEASKAGVKVELIIRGFCCLRPKVAGLSENIRVISIIGRFLEHSRIFYFQNGTSSNLEGNFFIGSADWMYRNLHARIEACVPIEDLQLRERLWEIIDLMLNDRRQAWELQPDGSYVQYKPATPEEELGTQRKLMELTKTRNSVSSKDIPIPLKVTRS